MSIWLTTDTHFYHDNMLRLCGRPPDFNQRIHQGIMTRVRPTDYLVHLGDIAMSMDVRAHFDFVQQWPGTHVLVRGNHDKRSFGWYTAHGWHWVCDGLILQRCGRRVLLTHKPSLLGDCDVNIHGHFHNCATRLPEDGVSETPQHMLLALEWCDYQPMPLDSLLERGAPTGPQYLDGVRLP